MPSTHRRGSVALSVTPIGSAIVAVLAVSATPARAQFTFTSIANTTNLTGVTAFSAARINDSGTVAFIGSGAYYLKTVGASVPSRLVGSGDATPVGSTYNALDTLYYTLDNSNRVTFSSTINVAGSITTANRQALFVDNGGTVTTVLQTGTTVLPSGVTTSAVGGYSANNSGAIAVQLAAQTSGPTSVIYEYSGSGAFSGASTVAATGQTAPGATGGSATFGTFAFPVLDNNGNVSFFSNLANDPISNFSEYRATASGTATKIMAGGDAAPGTGNPTQYFTYSGKVVSNDASQAAFLGGAATVTISGGVITVGSTQTRGIWFAQPDGTLSAVALQGQDDLDGAGGTFKTGGSSGTTFTLGNLNNNGTGVFYASGLTGTTMTAADYIFTSSGYSLLLGVGQSFFGSTVSSLGTPWINNSGQIVGNYGLANGQSGVFEYAIGSAAAPEPGSMAVMAPVLLGGVAAWGMRRRSVRRDMEATRA